MSAGDVKPTSCKFAFAFMDLTTEQPLQEDMSRTEELTTKLRTLSYDHERLTTMHRTATEKASSAEKEMNLHKSRLA